MTEYKENAINSCRSFRKNRTKLKFRGRILLEYSISQYDVKRINSFLSGSSTDITDDETTAETAGEVYKRIGTVTNRETGDTETMIPDLSGNLESCLRMLFFCLMRILTSLHRDPTEPCTKRRTTSSDSATMAHSSRLMVCLILSGILFRNQTPEAETL